MNAIVTTSVSAILQGIGSLLCGIAIAFNSSWRLAIIALIGCPLIVLTGIIEAKMMASQGNDEKDGEDEKLATDVRVFQETATNMKTVNAISSQNLFIEKFKNIVHEVYKGASCKGLKTGLIYGLGQASMFVVYAAVFYAGAIFTYKYDLSFQDMFRALFGIIFAGFGAGMAQQFMPDMGAAQKAANEIYEMIDTENKIIYPKNGSKKEIKGRIEFKNVSFRYPGRENFVFKNMSFVIEPNQKVAFAGPSGMGKSTIFKLLYRFYDVDEGQILVDGVNIRDYDINHLRNNIGMVEQEPKLFNASIEYNIK